MVEILKNGEVYLEFESDNDNEMLYRAMLDAELWTRDKEGEYTARIKPIKEDDINKSEE